MVEVHEVSQTKALGKYMLSCSDVTYLVGNGVLDSGENVRLMPDHNESQLGIWVQVISVRTLRFHIAFVSCLLAAVRNRYLVLLPMKMR
jgi:hypothetical protein